MSMVSGPKELQCIDVYLYIVYSIQTDWNKSWKILANLLDAFLLPPVTLFHTIAVLTDV